ncbi:tyrosine-type recombinase/integrase [Acinetobacter guillouiae]|uniref:tyrosine-type recombinase/integrase n=1 Tax=Acinetobacter guillouiae TaxID=106649 RepID=UPI0026E2E4FD|nr:tyrosine-type recombinase/integrase [Acinetobacter guillouiae]MDO6646350.1 tyrosine-type recombinase/integrase [Acinetobacter guillouiae]
MLSDSQVKALKPKEKRYSLADGEGLSVDVFPTGKKKWIVSYRVNGKQTRKNLGEYPELGCKDARQLARQCKAEAQGKMLNSPSVNAVIEEWLKLMTPRWSSKKYIDTVIYRLNYITEDFKNQPIDEVDRKIIVKKVKEIVNKGTLETAKRSLRLLNEIFNFAIASDYTQKNPCTLISDVIPQQTVRNMPSLDAEQMPGFWNRVTHSNVTPELLHALKLACYTAVRISELLQSRWDSGEIDLENRQWVIPASRMKMRRDHVVPLTDQTYTLFKELYDHKTDYGYIFKHTRNPGEHVRSESILAIIKRNGYAGQMVTHGFRSLFSTHTNNSKLFRPDVIEYQIAHVPKDRIRGIYNRAEYWDERVELMKWYSEQVDRWMKGAN